MVWTLEREGRTTWLVLGGKRVARMDGGSDELARRMVKGLNLAEKMRDVQVRNN